MCIKSNLQQHIRNLTNDGEVVARFLVDTVEGRHTGAKYHHKLEAAKLLDRYGLTDDTLRHSRENGNPEGQGEDESPLSPRERVRVRGEHKEQQISHLDILNYEIAHLIRTETADGHTIAEFLSHVMTRRDQPFTPKKLRIRQTDRMAAAREILRRGHGHFGRKPKLTVYADDVEDTNDYDTLHTDLAKRMREYSEHGTAATRFLLDVMSDTSLDTEEAYTWHHKMSAAHELIRRGWDTNYDNITPEMLQAYWQNQQSTRLSIGQKKHLAGLPTFTDEYDQYDSTDYKAITNEMTEAESHEQEYYESPVEKPPLPAGEGWGEGKSPFPQIESDNKVGTTDSHSHPSSNQAEQDAEAESPFSPSRPPKSAPVSAEINFNDDADPDIDYYIEPLTPEEEAVFNYNSLIESGEFKEGEISIVPPSDAARHDHAIALHQIREAAAADGVPLLPNPLAGTLKMPAIRSP